jgi:hypothetical protein
MKKQLASAFVILALSGPLFSGPLLAAQPEMLLRERCRSDECTFTKIVTKRRIAQNAQGRMIEVKSRSVVVPVAKGTDPQAVPSPDSFGLVRVSYAFCSTEKPAIILYNGKKFSAHMLNIAAETAGSAINAQIEYWAACHDRIVSVNEVTEGRLAKDAEKLGYHALPAEDIRRRDFRTKKRAFRFFGL